MKNKFAFLFPIVILIFITVIMYSCKKNSETTLISASGKALINIKVSDIFFEEEIFIHNKAKTSDVASAIAPKIQRDTVDLDNTFQLVTEFSEIKKVSDPSYKTKRSSANAINITSNIFYQVYVFDQNGKLVTWRNYQHGKEKEASLEPLFLDDNKKYTFISLSSNSINNQFPVLQYRNENDKSLATAHIEVKGTDDIMYHKQEMIVSNSKENNLNINFRHLFSQITTTIDVSDRTHNITAVRAAFSAHYPLAQIQLTDGAITRAGSVGSLGVTFLGLNSQTVISQPTIMNTFNTNRVSFNISSIIVGNKTYSNLQAFTNLNVRPGANFNMKVNFISKDGYEIIDNQPAVRINGQIWMRHNLGADITVDADEIPVKSNLHGNYYQWGRITIVGNGSSATVSRWDGQNFPDSKSWNSSGDDNISGRVNDMTGVRFDDPCPKGYMVPTKTQMTKLLESVVSNQIGVLGFYSRATVLTSKSNSKIKMTIPAQGWYSFTGTNRPFVPGPIQDRGHHTYLWTSYHDGRSLKILSANSSTTQINDLNTSNTVASYPIRCISVNTR